MTQQIETLRTAKLESVEQLAAILEPLAQAMAALTDDTRQTLESVEAQSRHQGERIARQIEGAAKVFQEAALNAQRSAQRLEHAGQGMNLSHYAVALATGMVAATLASLFWLW